MATITEIEKLIAAGRLDDARAINAYNRAKLIEPEGPAAAAIESIYDIIRFVNTDLMNP